MEGDGDLFVRRGVMIPAAELRETASRSSGPGGQHVNKTNTRVTLHWSPVESAALSEALRARLCERLAHRITRAGDLVVHASQERSRARNRKLARERLAELVREALRVQPPRVPTRVSAGAKRRGLEAKRRRSATKRARRRPRGDDDA